MSTYDVTFNSDPQGVPVCINGIWRTTPHTEKFNAGAQVIARIHNTARSNTNFYVFKNWTKNNTVVSGNPLLTFTATETCTYTANFEQITYFPTRRPEYRKDKFEAKVDGDIFEKRYDTLKPTMTAQYRLRAEQQEALEQEIGRYLNSLGLTGIQLHNYRNFAQELYALKNKFTDQTLTNMATIKAQRWTSEGLNKNILTEIAKRLGITINLP